MRFEKSKAKKVMAAALACAMAASMMAAVPAASAAAAATTTTTAGNSKVTLTKDACAADEHEFEYSETKEATCTKPGSYIEVCGECESKITTTIPALGHVPAKLPTVAATCTEPGLTEGEACIRCGEKTKEQKAVPALGHSYKSVTVKATCTKAGYTAKQCTRCGTVKDKKAIAKLGHKYSTKWSKDKTCHYKKCTRSGCTAVKSKAKHSYKSGSKTCTTCGYKKK